MSLAPALTATCAALEAARAALARPVDAAGLGAFRALFGAVLLFSVVRFAAYGWIDELLVDPSFHFTYWGFEWVRPWPRAGMYAHFALMGLAALGLMLGAFTRLSAALFFVTFTYAELIEKAAYLNHYYFVSVMSLLLVFVPAGNALSVDAWRWRRRGGGPRPVRLASYALLRAQLALVYFFAGFAKLDGDWLFYAEPLTTWLARHADAPLLGPLLAEPGFAHVLSIAGAAYDLTIWAFLSWPKTRPFAYAAVVVFHVSVWLLFPIGVFSWVMIGATTIFFEPSWPKRLRARRARDRASCATSPDALASAATASVAARPRRLLVALASAHLALQALFPLRFLLYPGEVNWHEQGFRFAWRVMLIEKTGQVELEVVSDDPPRRRVVSPRAELTRLQYKEMSTQPDMILEYARHVGAREAARLGSPVRVYAHAWASLNGRPRQRLIDPHVDLMRVEPGPAPKPWIVPLAHATTSGVRSSGTWVDR